MKKSLPKYDFCNVVGWSICKYIGNTAKINEIDSKKNPKNGYKHKRLNYFCVFLILKSIQNIFFLKKKNQCDGIPHQLPCYLVFGSIKHSDQGS